MVLLIASGRSQTGLPRGKEEAEADARGRRWKRDLHLQAGCLLHKESEIGACMGDLYVVFWTVRFFFGANPNER